MTFVKRPPPKKEIIKYHLIAFSMFEQHNLVWVVGPRGKTGEGYYGALTAPPDRSK